MKIKIEDFQSIAETEVDAIGFTVVTGTTNVGKTAFIRALDAALFGKPGDHYIRRGENTTRVCLSDVDLVLEWQKTNKPAPDRQTYLKTNGVLHSKLGRDHESLTKPLGFAAIETSQTRFRPQVALQHDQPFLLFDSATEVAELLRKVARADTTARATDLARKDKRDGSSKLNTRETDLEDAEAKLGEIADLETLIQQRDQLRSTAHSLALLETKNVSLVNLLERLKEVQPQVVPSEPRVGDVPRQVALLAQLERHKALKPSQVPIEPQEIKSSMKFTQLEILEHLTKVLEEQTQAQQEVDSLLAEAEAIYQEKRELEKELKVCPTCARPFEGTHAH